MRKLSEVTVDKLVVDQKTQENSRKLGVLEAWLGVGRRADGQDSLLPGLPALFLFGRGGF